MERMLAMIKRLFLAREFPLILLAFAGFGFVWPQMAFPNMDNPLWVTHLLYAHWLVVIVLLFVFSRYQHQELEKEGWGE